MQVNDRCIYEANVIIMSMKFRPVNFKCFFVVILTILLPLVSFSSELFYTIQSGSFPDIKHARRHFDSILERLHEKDLSYLRIEKVGGFYSVRIGRFEDYDTAEKLLKANESQLYKAMILKAYIKDERIVALHGTAALSESGKVDKDSLSKNFRTQTTEHRTQNTEHRLQNTDYRTQSTDCRYSLFVRKRDYGRRFIIKHK